jgi:2-polyprenyl-3-methyl-5-hydroxy-6-metoxy-1,4-benzoquinol methylase
MPLPAPWSARFLESRHLTPELMDDPGIDPAEHRKALCALARLNRISHADRLLWEPIARLAMVPGHPPLRILDIATGSGDLPLALAAHAHKAGIHLSIAGCDVSATALEEARRRAAAAGQEMEFLRCDVLEGEVPSGYDVITCSLFMHHLTEEQVVDVLYRMRCAAQRMVLVSDLRRCLAGYLLAAYASSFFTRSRIAQVDARKSVRAAFTPDEFAALAAEAGLDSATLECRWPCRLVLQWKRDS